MLTQCWLDLPNPSGSQTTSLNGCTVSYNDYPSYKRTETDGQEDTHIGMVI